MLQAVIFDMDGVIIDSHPAHREAWRLFLLTLGRVVSDDELDFVLDGRKRGEILRHFLGDLSEDEAQKFGNLKDEYFRKAFLQVKPLPGVVELVRQLRIAGIATAVATSGSGSRTRHTLDHLKLADEIDVVVTGDDVTLGKPDPSIYLLASERLKVKPSCSLAVEDAVSGIRAARGAGLICVGVSGNQSAQSLWKAGAACVVENFIDLCPVQLELLLQQPRFHIPHRLATPCS